MKKKEVKENLLLGIASGTMTGLIFLLGDISSEIAKMYSINGGWLFLIKTIVICIGIWLLFNRIEKKFK